VKALCLNRAFTERPHSGNSLGGTDDNSPDTQEPDEVKVLKSDSKAAAGSAMAPPTVT
jgi:hypothetical protein